MSDAHQRLPVTTAVQGMFHEQIILGGSPFVSAIFGPDAYLSQAPSIPVFYTEPVITGSIITQPFVDGSIVVLSLLTCDEGSFNSSPRAALTYQWKRDTVNITDETNNTYQTVLSDIDTTLTCEVTATNSSGADTGLSNGLLVAAVEASNVYEMGAYFITGLDALGRMDMNVAETFVISGLSSLDKMDVDTANTAIITGFAHEDKVDINTGEVTVITGLSHYLKAEINVGDSFAITGLQGLDQMDINEAEVYVTRQSTFLETLALLNGDAQEANMDDWVMDLNTVTMVTSAPGWSFNTNRTGPVFKGEDAGQGVNSQMSQVVELGAGILTDVDLGRCLANFSYSFYAERHYDYIEVTLQALSAADAVLATQMHQVGPYPDVGQYDSFGWFERQTSVDDPLVFPTLTRKIKVIILFKASASGSAANTAYIDNIVVDILKLE